MTSVLEPAAEAPVEQAGRRRQLRWGTRSRLLNGGLGIAVLLVVALIVWAVRGGDTTPAASSRTTTVSTGDVTATVTANGNVASGTTTNLDFQGGGGEVTSILVKEGQRVRQGQALAAIDDADARQALKQAQGQLDSAEASYATTVQGRTTAERARDATSVQGARASLRTAQVGLGHARESQRLTRSQQDAVVAAAESGLASARATRSAAQSTYDSDPSQANRDALSAAQSAEASASSSLTQARTARQSALLQARQAVENAERQVVAARNSLASTRASVAVNAQPPRAGSVAAARAQVETAQGAVTDAEQTLDQTVLRAPVAGKVAKINGVVGQSSTSTTSSGSGASGSTTSSASTSTSGFLTLTSPNLLEVTASVAEADIGEVRVGQPATVTLSSSNRALDATVTRVATVETITNNVVEYPVTVTLSDPRGVRLGQSTSVSVTTGSKQGVTRVSTSALTTIGERTTATVRKTDGTEQVVPVTTGLEGDGFTQVLSGLEVGDVVVLPQSSGGASGFTFPGVGGLGGPR